MRFEWSSFALQTVNFAILVWLLHRFLYRPVLRLIDARRAEIDRQYADAGIAENKAKAELAAALAERADIARERAAALVQAAAQAEKAAAELLARAEREAAVLLDSARAALAAERQAVLAEAKHAALDLAAEIAGKLLTEVPVGQDGEAWLTRAEQHLSALPEAEREALAQQLVDGAELKVTTASPLPVETIEAWRARLRRLLGNRVTVSFDVDPHLFAGADLHFPNTILHFSWQSALESMHAEIGDVGDPR